MVFSGIQWVPCTFRVPEKTFPVAPVASKPLQAKMLQSSTLDASRALKRILEAEFDEKMVKQFFREFAMMKACKHLNIATVFLAYELLFPALIMELPGKMFPKAPT